MASIRRICSSVRLPHIRCSRFRLYVTFTATALLFSIFTLSLNFIHSSVRSEVQDDMTSSQLPKYSTESTKMDFVNIQRSFVQRLSRESLDRPNKTAVYPKESTTKSPVESPTSTSVWDSSLTYTDRIVEQLNYIPRRLNSKIVNILVWNKGGGERIVPGNSKFIDDSCLVRNCFIMIAPPIDSTHVDAIITSNNLREEMFYLVKSRRAEDVWIYYDLERPSTMTQIPIREAFNWTATYRHESTLVAPYEKWVPFKKSSSYQFQNSALTLTYNNTRRNYASGKSKMAAALISNCSARRRLGFIGALSRYIKVDILGGCGTICGDDCLGMIRRDYKFYLAFENSNCVDYITEKLFKNALNNDIIPVVFGAPAPDYIRSSPPFSYIHINNFPSLVHLAKYLNDLDQNDTLYNEYFQWKGTGSFINTKFWCRLCALLNDLDKPRLIVHDLSKWLNDRMCDESIE